jgi:hypothetical protein
MILPDFVLPYRQHKILTESGTDSLKQCSDKEHFKSYPHQIEYKYNSRGFRDAEWPEDLAQLKQAIWCIGDSYTVGIGSPLEHTWVAQVSKQLGTRTINVSMPIASNYWMTRKTLDILTHIRPDVIIIQWSHILATESNDVTLSDEDRRVRYEFDNWNWCNDLDLGLAFIELVKKVEVAKQHTKVIHSFIPKFGIDNKVSDAWAQISGPDWPACPATLDEFNALGSGIVNELINSFKLYDWFYLYYNLHHNIEYIPEIKNLDLARDSYHYDLLTAQHFAIGVRQLLNRGS